MGAGVRHHEPLDRYLDDDAMLISFFHPDPAYHDVVMVMMLLQLTPEGHRRQESVYWNVDMIDMWDGPSPKNAVLKLDRFSEPPGIQWRWALGQLSLGMAVFSAVWLAWWLLKQVIS